MILSLFITLIIIIFDQGLKLYIQDQIPIGHQQSFIAGILDLTHVHNTGAGWSLFEGHLGVFVLITIMICIYILYLIFKHRESAWHLHLAYGLLLGGALGNFIDRVRLGYVVDMFQTRFINFPIFNIADASLTLSIILLLLIMLISKEDDIL